MAQTIKSQSPLRGINRALSREAQPEASIFDALNVLPFERYGRLRAGQRAGTNKLWATPLAGATSILGLQQTTIALDPTDTTAGATLFSETFPYADGDLGTVGSANWQVRSGGGGTVNSWANAIDVAGFSVVSNRVTLNAGHLASSSTARYIANAGAGPTGIGSAFIIQADFIMNSTGVPARVGVSGRVNSTPTNGSSVDAHVRPTGGNFILGLVANSAEFASVTLPAGVITSGVSFTLALHANGDNFSAYVNGIKYLAGTSSFNSGFSGVGFGMVGSGIAGMFADNFLVFQGNSLTSYRQTNIVAVSNGSVYEGDIAAQATVVTGGSAALAIGGVPGMASLFGKMYFVDGRSTLKQLDLLTRVLIAPTITAGGSPAEDATSLGQYQLACAYRGRLVLGANRTNPQNFVMSRVGTPTDFDYSQTDPATAFAGNASKAGQIGDPITALIPFSDDLLLIGGDHNLWAVRGDPADGGSIDLISDAIGVLGANAWCKAPDGTVYFIGTGGLFRMGPQDHAPTNISLSAYPQFFASLNRSTNYLNMVWDRDRQGCYVFVTPVSAGAGIHLWYDLRTESFWPIQYPANHGPISAIVYDGDADTDRTLLLGGRTGFVQEISNTQRNDDGTAITSYLIFGPMLPNDGFASTMTGVTFDFGELSSTDSSSPDRWQSTVQLRSGKTAYDVTEGTPTNTATVIWGRDRRTKTFRQRLRGEWFTVKISDAALNNYWAFETMWADFEPAGKNRRQR